LKLSASLVSMTTEANSAVSLRLWKQIPRFQWDHRSGFGSFNETAEIFKKFHQHSFYTER
jgi:hypothetical protein